MYVPNIVAVHMIVMRNHKSQAITKSVGFNPCAPEISVPKFIAIPIDVEAF